MPLNFVDMEIEFPNFSEIETSFDLNFDDFAATEIDLQTSFETRYIKPPRSRDNGDRQCRYDKALKMANEIKVSPGCYIYAEVSGNFIFGDFIEALFHAKGWTADRLVISTLSMSMNNVDSLANILKWGWVDSLDLIVSDHFFSHERQMLIPYLYEKLDFDNRFQLAAARSHKKTALIQTKCGMKIVIHGSVNLRSSGNLEQFVIEENPELFNFDMHTSEKILSMFATINKDVPRLAQKSPGKKETWEGITNG